MMATLKEFFGYNVGLCCGIPRVTLEGENDDWVYLLNRIGKLKDIQIRFGNELVPDGVSYPRLDSSNVPGGTAQVNVTLKMGLKDCSTALIAGSVGTEIFSSGDESLSGDGKRDSARPAIGWWWVLKKEKKPTIYRNVAHSTSNIALT